MARNITLSRCRRDLELDSEKLEMGANIAISCLKNNEMVSIPKKFQLVFSAGNNIIQREMRKI